MHRILLAGLALALIGNSAYSQTDRRGESICGERSTENIAVTWVWKNEHRQFWSGSGPVQVLWTTYRGEEEVLDKLVIPSDVAPRYATTWRNSIGTPQTIPNPTTPCLRYSYESTRNPGRVYTVFVYRLGTERESGDDDPRRHMPGPGR